MRQLGSKANSGWQRASQHSLSRYVRAAGDESRSGTRVLRSTVEFSTRQGRNMRRVVFCDSKGHGATDSGTSW